MMMTMSTSSSTQQRNNNNDDNQATRTSNAGNDDRDNDTQNDENTPGQLVIPIRVITRAPVVIVQLATLVNARVTLVEVIQPGTGNTGGDDHAE